MIVWRLCKKEYADLSGQGAFLYGGRWNSQGSPVVYTASSLSLACLEILVALPHLKIPEGYVSLEISIADSINSEHYDRHIDSIKKAENCRNIGDNWLAEKRSSILKVPSVIIPQESNILINPLHQDAHKIKIKRMLPFTFDPRLL